MEGLGPSDGSANLPWAINLMAFSGFEFIPILSFIFTGYYNRFLNIPKIWNRKVNIIQPIFWDIVIVYEGGM